MKYIDVTLAAIAFDITCCWLLVRDANFEIVTLTI